jgi:hypothetical protein
MKAVNYMINHPELCFSSCSESVKCEPVHFLFVGSKLGLEKQTSIFELQLLEYHGKRGDDIEGEHY